MALRQLNGRIALIIFAGPIVACNTFGSRPSRGLTPPGMFELPDTLRTMLVGTPIPCVDSAGRFDTANGPHCGPCAELNSSRMDLPKLDHSRRLYESPFPTEAFQRCVRHGIESAYLGLPDSVDMRFEKLAHEFNSPIPSRRVFARQRVNEIIAERLARADSITAARYIGIVGEIVWDRAERLLSRATTEPFVWEGGQRKLVKPTLIPLEQIEKEDRLMGARVGALSFDHQSGSGIPRCECAVRQRHLEPARRRCEGLSKFRPHSFVHRRGVAKQLPG